MTLTEFFQLKYLSRREFASEIGVDPVTVYRWENGSRLPVRHFARISEVTNGRVTANDFVQPSEAAQ